MLGPHQPFELGLGIVGISLEVALGATPDDALSLFVDTDNRRRQGLPVSVVDDLGLLAIEGGGGGVRRPEVDADMHRVGF